MKNKESIKIKKYTKILFIVNNVFLVFDFLHNMSVLTSSYSISKGIALLSIFLIPSLFLANILFKHLCYGFADYLSSNIKDDK